MTKRGVILCAVFVLGSLAAVFAVTRGHEMSDQSAGLAASAPATNSAKQLWTCGMHPQVIQDHPGDCPICHMKLTPVKSDSDDASATTAGRERKILYYWDPMLGPSSIAHAPGKSAMGMDLVPVFEDEQSAGPVVRIDPTIVQNMGVRTAEA